MPGLQGGSAKPAQKKPHLGPYFGSKGKGKGNKGKKGNKNEEDETMEEDAVMYDMSDRLIKMSLNSAQRIRELEGAVMRCLAIQKDSFIDTRLAEAGTDHNMAVQGQPGHGKGPPHIHIWSALVDAVLEDPALKEWDADKKAALQAYMTTKVEKQSQAELGLEVSACRRKTNYSKEGEAATCRVTWCCRATIEHEGATIPVDRLLVQAMLHTGAVLNLGAPPPGNHERVLGKMLRN